MKEPNVIDGRIRKLAVKQLHYRVVQEIRSKCIAKAMEEIEAGQWDALKQLRLDGVLHICKHAKPKDLKVSIIAWLAHQNGFEINFKLLPKERDDIEFTDTGKVVKVEPQTSDKADAKTA